MSDDIPPGPWVVTFEEYGGYDMMTSAYAVRDAKGRHLFSVDTGKRGGESPKVRAIAETAARGWFASQDAKNIFDVSKCPECGEFRGHGHTCQNEGSS